jgi:hypothetical protein
MGMPRVYNPVVSPRSPLVSGSVRSGEFDENLVEKSRTDNRAASQIHVRADAPCPLLYDFVTRSC